MLTWIANYMAQKIGQAVSDTVTWLTRTYNTLAPIVRKAWVWLVGIILAFIALTNYVIEFTWLQITKLIELVAHIGLRDADEVNAAVDSIIDTLGIINRIIPLAEAFAMLEALCLLMLICWAYRFVKSLVPTLT